MNVITYDVAEKAEVFTSPVLKGGNNRQDGKKSKQNVLKEIEKRDGNPHVLASALTEKRTSAIGILLPDIENPFAAEIARQVESLAQKAGYNLIICLTGFKQEKEENYVALLRQKSVDGLILAGEFKNKEVLLKLIDKGFPVTLLAAEPPPSLSVNTVTLDNFLGGYEVTSHLIGLGHKRIAVMAEETASSKERIRGYKQALQDNQLEFHESWIATNDSGLENAQRLTMQMLDLPNAPTAIVSSNDVLARGVLLGAREKNMHVPGDLSIAGFDNTILSKHCDPPLTTIEHPIQSMCTQAVDLLIEEIEGAKKEKQKIIALPKLIVRKSTGYSPLK